MHASQPAAVIGSGPNGLAAAVTLARAGVPVTVFEAAETVGGGLRSGHPVREDVLHDHCAAIHPLAVATGFFREFGITERVRFITPDVSYAHPLDGPPGRRAALAYRDLDRTAAELGPDGAPYARLFRPLLSRLEGLLDFSLGPTFLRQPRDLRAALAFGLRSLEQGTTLWNTRFREEAAPALLTGVAAHTSSPLPRLAPAAAGLVLGTLGHATGWPVPVGGSQAIAEALTADLLAHGGEIRTGHTVEDVRELAAFDVKIFDTSVGGLARIAGAVLPRRYRRTLERHTPGNGISKVDFILDGPIPWADPRVAAAPTVHLGGSRAEIARAEAAVARGQHPNSPYVIVVQADAFDAERNPAGRHAVWSYTHVPAGSSENDTSAVIAQIERFAPGFRDRLLDQRLTTAYELSRVNANYPGGDIGAGAVTLRNFVARPTLSRDPHRTPAAGIYLASAAASPGPGVHGLGGWYAARTALRHEYGVSIEN